MSEKLKVDDWSPAPTIAIAVLVMIAWYLSGIVEALQQIAEKMP